MKHIKFLNQKKYIKIKKNFNQTGYVKLKLFNKNDLDILKKKIKKKLNAILKKNKIKFKINSIENYHKLAGDKEIHTLLMNPDTRYIILDKKIKNKIFLRLEKFIELLWGHKNVNFAWIGELRNKKQLKVCATGFRIARPLEKKLKNNDATSIHVDKNFGGIINDDNKRLFTIWIPLIGFSKKYTLNISPNSHKKNHSKFLGISKNKITISLSKKYTNKFKFFRPNMKYGEVLLLNSNLLHGSSVNLGNKSRLSLDCRVINQERFSI